MSAAQPFVNPFRPGAGHPPPYLAGRAAERAALQGLLGQERILENPLLTGLRGVGKTVLLDSLKPVAQRSRWLWVGADLSESASLTERNLAVRLCADLAPLTSCVVVATKRIARPGLAGEADLVERRLTYDALAGIYGDTPGLASDKLKAVLETAWRAIAGKARGIVFAYDEAQHLTDRSATDEFPLSLLLDAFQSLQRQGLPLMLALAGLPTLFGQLVSARTFAERMFRVLTLRSLARDECREAILRPFRNVKGLAPSENAVEQITDLSGGYPYFIQFICREFYDVAAQRLGGAPRVPLAEIARKLDADFFAGRWERLTDRQRELLSVAAHLETSVKAPDADGFRFTLRELVSASRRLLEAPFGASHASQMLATLGQQGLVFKSGHGRYAFSLPLLGGFIARHASLDSSSGEDSRG